MMPVASSPMASKVLSIRRSLAHQPMFRERGAIHRREERRVACCRISRRHIQEAGVCLLGGAVLSLVREEQAWATEAATTESQVYSDKRTSFQIVPPADWTYGENEDPRTGKRIVGFYPVDKSLANTSVTVTASFSAADYTSMGSFGSPYEWAFRLVGSQDLKFKGDREQSATLLDYGRLGDLYFAEYRVYKPLTDENVHLFTAAGLGWNGVYNRLYTCTAQSAEELWESEKDALLKSLKTFKIPKASY